MHHSSSGKEQGHDRRCVVMIREITKVVRMTWLSIPRASMVAAAFCSFAGEMTLASPPPIPYGRHDEGIHVEQFEVGGGTS